MEEFKKDIIGLAIFCFSITISLLLIAIKLNLVFLESNAIGSGLIAFFMSTGFYVIFFRISVIVYDKYLFKVLNRRSYLNGEWYFVIYFPDLNSYRKGFSEIQHSGKTLLISGQTEKIENNEVRAHWHSELAKIKDNKLLFLFESIVSRKEQKIRKGMMILKINGRIPKQLRGHCVDILPNDTNGEICFYKDKGEFDARISEILESNKIQSDNL
jgi:hypothetical protein